MIRSVASRRRWAAILAALLIIAVAAVTLVARNSRATLPVRAESERPVLLLLTSLPLVFGERLSIEGAGSKTLQALETRYRLMPIAVADADSLEQGRMLFMAHARAQPAEALVALDAWVRSGGLVLLLADPMLEWHSDRPLGDSLRPSPMFPDTGLLAHWGLRLDAPAERGPALRNLEGRRVLTLSPGALFGRCAITADRLVADCRVGKGRALIIADADFLNIDRLDHRADGNLDSLLKGLARLEASDSASSS